MRRSLSAIHYGTFRLRETVDGQLFLALPVPLFRRMGMRAGTTVTIEVKDGQFCIHIPGMKSLTRAQLYRASAGWPELRRSLRRHPSSR